MERFAEREMWNISCGVRARLVSLRLDVGSPDHLGPFLGFVGDELTKIGRRARKHRAAQVGKTRLEFGIGESRVDVLVELQDWILILTGCPPTFRYPIRPVTVVAPIFVCGREKFAIFQPLDLATSRFDIDCPDGTLPR